jgi:hypothetical protein
LEDSAEAKLLNDEIVRPLERGGLGKHCQLLNHLHYHER